jgi:hypothetical protein
MYETNEARPDLWAELEALGADPGRVRSLLAGIFSDPVIYHHVGRHFLEAEDSARQPGAVSGFCWYGAELAWEEDQEAEEMERPPRDFYHHYLAAELVRDRIAPCFGPPPMPSTLLLPAVPPAGGDLASLFVPPAQQDDAASVAWLAEYFAAVGIDAGGYATDACYAEEPGTRFPPRRDAYDALAERRHRTLALRSAARLEVPGRELVAEVLHASPAEFWTQVDRLFRAWAQMRALRRDIEAYVAAHPDEGRSVEDILAMLVRERKAQREGGERSPDTDEG